ncbi:unnamed protein product [Tuber melanosporum]|uniref:(Perigord truffle) hypothetical protein n=1 Tax=Tuber melanosporum (strain Mel28) TaxID=656061 RepID=D5GJW5_TUBMM|nr:uncharacterized protein GSTUM_00009238001 [Tuber melanosporum]CAZ84808.1 unnamed protein product [Tuber melanosporum]
MGTLLERDNLDVCCRGVLLFPRPLFLSPFSKCVRVHRGDVLLRCDLPGCADHDMGARKLS